MEEIKKFLKGNKKEIIVSLITLFVIIVFIGFNDYRKGELKFVDELLAPKAVTVVKPTIISPTAITDGKKVEVIKEPAITNNTYNVKASVDLFKDAELVTFNLKQFIKTESVEGGFNVTRYSLFGSERTFITFKKPIPKIKK